MNNPFSKQNFTNIEIVNVSQSHKKYFAFTFLTFAISIVLFTLLIIADFFILGWVYTNYSEKMFFVYLAMMVSTLVYFVVSISYSFSRERGLIITFLYWLAVQITLPLLISFGLLYLWIIGDLNYQVIITILVVPALIILITGVLSYFDLVDLTKIWKVIVFLFSIIVITILISIVLYFTLSRQEKQTSTWYRSIDFILPVLYTVFLTFSTFFTWRQVLLRSQYLDITDNSKIFKSALASGIDLFVNFALLVYFILSIFIRRR
ncbi:MULTISPECIES: MAG0110 family membrane protein [unclassified Mycoplasma]|uniref:MAG0110 family membrane protein n=1 Tax=unclassified Mycoplasma TaxID=2683645 RepID=UPI00211C6130|nr:MULTISPECIES: hypothetical protein [unclassified Mycoplasma]UUM19628.1 hypothetical protein NPA11_02530 [Mycoplasma sp. 1578d]UUM24597.1 hypothetical protein NPA12_02755 [Mycoplasma sp. 3686d]